MKSKIRTLHGQSVIVDVDLAAIVGVAPKRLISLITRQRPKIPLAFVFPVSRQELGNPNPPIADARSSSRDAHLVLTEHGVILIAAMLRDPRAVELAIQVVRTFAGLREVLPSNAALASRIESLEMAIATLDRATQRHFKMVNEALDALAESPAPGIPLHRNLH